MHALVVVAHPDPSSLTHGLAAALGDEIARSGHTFEVADLTREGFDPRFTLADRGVHHRTGPAPADVVAEQARIERADAVVLVYPVFWWSMPAILKGWIDRVFSNGWAFDDGPGGVGLVRKLGHLHVHLVAVAGSDEPAYLRHGYQDAMRTQIDHGVFGYCGAAVSTSRILFDAELGDPLAHLDAARDVGRTLFGIDPARESADAA